MASLSQLVSRGDATVIRSPRDIAQSGQEAHMLLTDGMPAAFYDSSARRFELRDLAADVELTVKPTIIGDGFLTCEGTLEAWTLPEPSAQRSVSRYAMRVHDGDTIAFGGFLRGIRWFSRPSSDPVLDKGEIIITLTPKIIP